MLKALGSKRIQDVVAGTKSAVEHTEKLDEFGMLKLISALSGLFFHAKESIRGAAAKSLVTLMDREQQPDRYAIVVSHEIFRQVTARWEQTRSKDLNRLNQLGERFGRDEAFLRQVTAVDLLLRYSKLLDAVFLMVRNRARALRWILPQIVIVCTALEEDPPIEFNRNLAPRFVELLEAASPIAFPRPNFKMATKAANADERASDELKRVVELLRGEMYL